MARKVREYTKILRKDARVRDRVLSEMTNVFDEYHARVRVLIADPTRRMVLEPTKEHAARHPIVRFLWENTALDAGVAQNAIESRVRLQLLAVHAAIRRFRWENDRLPKSLDEMKIALRLATDPFTAKPLLYKPDGVGIQYDLASAGALVPGEDGKPDTRKPITLPRERRKP